MITRIILVVFALVLQACGGGGGQSEPLAEVSAKPIQLKESPESEHLSNAQPFRITNETLLDIDAPVAPVMGIEFGSTRYFSFSPAVGQKYRIGLQSLSGNADIVIRESSELTDSSILVQSTSNTLVEILTFNAYDDSRKYIAVNTVEHNTMFKLYVVSESAVADRLKIFVSSEKHNGNLAADRALAGNNAIEKADHICKTSAAKPDNAIYKALLIDGLYRDAINTTDWVLKPNQWYYRSDGVIPIGVTDALGKFSNDNSMHAGPLLSNVVNDCSDCDSAEREVWTGISDTRDMFAFYFSNCGGWATSAANVSGAFGLYTDRDEKAFHSEVGECMEARKFYCVQQL